MAKKLCGFPTTSCGVITGQMMYHHHHGFVSEGEPSIGGTKCLLFCESFPPRLVLSLFWIVKSRPLCYFLHNLGLPLSYRISNFFSNVGHTNGMLGIAFKFCESLHAEDHICGSQ